MNRIEVIYEIQAKADKLESELQKVKNSFSKLENTNKSLVSSLVAGFGKFSAVLAGVWAVIQSLKGGIETLVNLKRLEVALKNVGYEGERLRNVFKELTDEAERLSKITGIDDDVIVKMYQLGIQAGLTVEETKELQKVAMNVAVAFGLDMENAMIQLIRTFQVGESQLTRYDARLKALVSSGASNAEIAEYLTKTYSGMVEEIGKIDVIQRVMTRFQSLLEQIGIALYPVISGILTLAEKIITRLQPAFQRIEPVLERFEPLLKVISDGFLYLVDIVVGAFERVIGVIDKVSGFISEKISGNIESSLKAIKSEIERRLNYFGVREVLEKVMGEPVDVSRLLKFNEETLKSIFSQAMRKANKPQEEQLVSILELVGRYKTLELEIDRNISKERKNQVNISKETIAGIRRQVDEVGKAKDKQSDVFEMIYKQIKILSEIFDIEKDRGDIVERVVSFYEKEYELLGRQKILGMELKEILSEPARIMGIPDDEREKVIQIAKAYQNLGKEIQNVSQKSQEVSKDNEKYFENLKEDIDAITSSFLNLLDAIENINTKTGSVKEGISSIVSSVKYSVEMISKAFSGDVIGSISSGIMAISSIISGITSITSFYLQNVGDSAENYKEIERELNNIKTLLELVNEYQSRFVRGSKEWVNIEKQKKELLEIQFETLKKQLGISEVSFENVSTRIQQLQRERDEIQRMLDTILRIRGGFGTVFGINTVAGNIWNVYAGIVNRLYEMGKISRETKDAWLDNYNVTTDIENMISLLNREIEKYNGQIGNANELLRIQKQLQDLLTNAKKEELNYELRRYQLSRDIAEMTSYRMKDVLEKRKKQIQDQINAINTQIFSLNFQILFRRFFGRNTADLEQQISSLVSVRDELVAKLSNLTVSYEEGIQEVYNKILQNLRSQIENRKKYLELVKDTNEKLEIQKEILHLETEIYRKNIEMFDEMLSFYENEQKISEMRGEDTRKYIEKQIEILKQQKKIADNELDIAKSQEIQIKILEKEKELQETINKVISDRIRKMKELVSLGIIDVENVKDVAMMIQEMRKYGISEIEIAKNLQDIGVRAGGMIQNITQSWNVSLNYVSEDLFRAFLSRNF